MNGVGARIELSTCVSAAMWMITSMRSSSISYRSPSEIRLHRSYLQERKRERERERKRKKDGVWRRRREERAM
jgi:hypothetical protein